MTLSHCLKAKSLILAAALSSSLGLVTHASAQELRSYLVDLNTRKATELGTLGGDFSIARGMNDAGQVVGQSERTEVFSHAFITGPDGMGMRDLGTLDGDESSTALGINDAGQVVGFSSKSGGGPAHAFITGPDGMGMTDLGTLGGDEGTAYGINDAGQVVGLSRTTIQGSFHAFITGPNGEGMMDLNSLVDLPEEVILTGVIDINNNGQILVTGVIPEPETYALMLAGLGLVGFMARVGR